jgi:hypothetical protein
MLEFQPGLRLKYNGRYLKSEAVLKVVEFSNRELQIYADGNSKF